MDTRGFLKLVAERMGESRLNLHAFLTTAHRRTLTPLTWDMFTDENNGATIGTSAPMEVENAGQTEEQTDGQAEGQTHSGVLGDFVLGNVSSFFVHVGIV